MGGKEGGSTKGDGAEVKSLARRVLIWGGEKHTKG